MRAYWSTVTILHLLAAGHLGGEPVYRRLLEVGPFSTSIFGRGWVRIGRALPADCGVLALRIEKPSNVTLSGTNSLLDFCSLARGGCLRICREFVTLPGT